MAIIQDLNPAARLYVATVILAGAAAGAWLIAAGSYPVESWIPFALFTGVGVVTSAISMAHRGSAPTRITYQIGSSFVYPLLVLVDSGSVCLAVALITLADAAINRRRLLNTAFNVGQLWLSTALVVEVASRLFPGFRDLSGLAAPAVGSALLAMTLFAVANHGFAIVATRLVNRRPLGRWNWVSRNALLNETLCVIAGLGMAVLWFAKPWLAVLGVIAIWTTGFMLALLHRREQELELRELELRALQGLGLELGSELEQGRLHDAVLRIACEAVEVQGAMLAEPGEDPRHLEVRAHSGILPPPPPRIELIEPLREVLRDGRTRPCTFAGLVLPGVSGLMLAPLEIRGRRGALLALTHGPDRRPFDDEDVRRLEILVPFVNVALSNARLVDELRRIQDQLIHTEKMSAMGMLVAGVAHELNNPLTSVLGYAELLAGDEKDARRVNMLERIRSESKRAARIVQNLLTFSRKREPEMRTIDINELLLQVLEFRAYELSVRNTVVERNLAPGLPPVRVDTHQFQQVFLNLLTNAEQAIEQAGRAGRITVKTARRGDAVAVRISDNGSGIRPEDLQQIFVPFFTTKEVGQGTGLGLSICYGVVEAHGGTIEVDSRPGQGAEFRVLIPAAGAAQTAEPSGLPRTVATLPSGRFRGRILVVDDEEPIQQLVTDYFGAQGWTVIAAREGGEALELIEELDFDVLLVDLRMPGMGGQELFERLRESRPELLERIVFATGATASPEAERFLAGVPNVVLRKPYDLEQLARVVVPVAERSARGGVAGHLG